MYYAKEMGKMTVNRMNSTRRKLSGVELRFNDVFFSGAGEAPFSNNVENEKSPKMSLYR